MQLPMISILHILCVVSCWEDTDILHSNSDCIGSLQPGATDKYIVLINNPTAAKTASYAQTGSH